MDRITQSLLTEFSGEHGIDTLPEDQRFEHFCAYVTVRRHYGETFDSGDIVVGQDGGGDTGIDAIAILVNGTLITDKDTFEDLNENSGTLDVMFIFVQADRGSSFQTAKIGQFLYGVQDFFKPDPSLPRNQAIKDAAALMAAIYAQASKFKRSNPSCRLYYVTTVGLAILHWKHDDRPLSSISSQFSFSARSIVPASGRATFSACTVRPVTQSPASLFLPRASKFQKCPVSRKPISGIFLHHSFCPLFKTMMVRSSRQSSTIMCATGRNIIRSTPRFVTLWTATNARGLF